MIDTHCHLDLPVFDEDCDSVVARARAAGVEQIVVPAIRPSTFAPLWDSAGRHGVAFALGIHPQVVPALFPEEKAVLSVLARAVVDSGAIAIGECGLDGATGDHEEQERIFRAQIRIARELKLPLLVHVLKAHDWAPRVMKEERAGDAGGIMHSYSGGAELVPVYRDLGFAFSFCGPVTYAGARRPLEAVRAVPDELLLVETDAPDQSPVPHRRKRCEPSFLPEIVAAIARARGTTPEAIDTLTTRNARRVLNFQHVVEPAPPDEHR